MIKDLVTAIRRAENNLSYETQRSLNLIVEEGRRKDRHIKNLEDAARGLSPWDMPQLGAQFQVAYQKLIRLVDGPR